MEVLRLTFLIALPVLLGTGAPLSGQADDSKKESGLADAQKALGKPTSEKKKLSPAVELEVRLAKLSRDLRLKPTQRVAIRRLIEDEQIKRAMAAASVTGASDADAGKRDKSAALMLMLQMRASATTEEISPKLPGVKAPKPPLRMNPALRGLEPETHMRILRELDLRQTQKFVHLLGAEGLLGMRVASLRTRLALARLGGKSAGIEALLGGAGGGGSPLEAIFGGAGLGGAGLPGLGGSSSAGGPAVRPPALGPATKSQSSRASSPKKKKKKKKKKRRRRR